MLDSKYKGKPIKPILISSLTPLFKRAFYNVVALISDSPHTGVLEINSRHEDQEIDRVLQPAWLVRLGASASWQPMDLPLGQEQTTIVDLKVLDQNAMQALVITADRGIFLTEDGSQSWREANFGEPSFLNGGNVKIISTGPKPVVYALIDQNSAFTQGENPLLRLKKRSWWERLRIGLIGVLQ